MSFCYVRKLLIYRLIAVLRRNFSRTISYSSTNIYPNKVAVVALQNVLFHNANLVRMWATIRELLLRRCFEIRLGPFKGRIKLPFRLYPKWIFQLRQFGRTMPSH